MRPPKQARAQLLFESLDPGGEGRLTDRERKRCASHVPLSGNLDEPFDLREEHGNHLVVMIDIVDHTALIFRLDGWSATS